jgi:N-acetyl-anhydromuramyl-L-alanine amidase AmpD
MPRGQGRRIDLLVVHHSASPLSTTIQDIRKWHMDDNGWDDIGYHYVIHQDGSIHAGRPIWLMGAHALGANLNSIGICVVGNNLELHNRWNRQQIQSLFKLWRAWRLIIPDIRMIGHQYAGKTKTECPGVELDSFRTKDI